MTLDKIALTSKDSLPVIVAYNSLLYVTILLCVSLHIIFHFTDGDSHIIHCVVSFKYFDLHLLSVTCHPRHFTLGHGD